MSELIPQLQPRHAFDLRAESRANIDFLNENTLLYSVGRHLALHQLDDPSLAPTLTTSSATATPDSQHQPQPTLFIMRPFIDRVPGPPIAISLGGQGLGTVAEEKQRREAAAAGGMQQGGGAMNVKEGDGANTARSGGSNHAAVASSSPASSASAHGGMKTLTLAELNARQHAAQVSELAEKESFLQDRSTLVSCFGLIQSAPNSSFTAPPTSSNGSSSSRTHRARHTSTPGVTSNDLDRTTRKQLALGEYSLLNRMTMISILDLRAVTNTQVVQAEEMTQVNVKQLRTHTLFLPWCMYSEATVTGSTAAAATAAAASSGGAGRRGGRKGVVTTQSAVGAASSPSNIAQPSPAVASASSSTTTSTDIAHSIYSSSASTILSHTSKNRRTTHMAERAVRRQMKAESRQARKEVKEEKRRKKRELKSTMPPSSEEDEEEVERKREKKEKRRRRKKKMKLKKEKQGDGEEVVSSNEDSDLSSSCSSSSGSSSSSSSSSSEDASEFDSEDEELMDAREEERRRKDEDFDYDAEEEVMAARQQQQQQLHTLTSDISTTTPSTSTPRPSTSSSHHNTPLITRSLLNTLSHTPLNESLASAYQNGLFQEQLHQHVMADNIPTFTHAISLSFSPDSRYLAILCNGPRYPLFIWDWSSRSRIVGQPRWIKQEVHEVRWCHEDVTKMCVLGRKTFLEFTLQSNMKSQAASVMSPVTLLHHDEEFTCFTYLPHRKDTLVVCKLDKVMIVECGKIVQEIDLRSVLERKNAFVDEMEEDGKKKAQQQGKSKSSAATTTQRQYQHRISTVCATARGFAIGTAFHVVHCCEDGEGNDEKKNTKKSSISTPLPPPPPALLLLYEFQHTRSLDISRSTEDDSDGAPNKIVRMQTTLFDRSSTTQRNTSSQQQSQKQTQSQSQNHAYLTKSIPLWRAHTGSSSSTSTSAFDSSNINTTTTSSSKLPFSLSHLSLSPNSTQLILSSQTKEVVLLNLVDIDLVEQEVLDQMGLEGWSGEKKKQKGASTALTTLNPSSSTSNSQFLSSFRTLFSGLHDTPILSLDIAQEQPLFVTLSKDDRGDGGGGGGGGGGRGGGGSVKIWNYLEKKCEMVKVFGGGSGNENIDSYTSDSNDSSNNTPCCVAMHPHGSEILVALRSSLLQFRILLSSSTLLLRGEICNISHTTLMKYSPTGTYFACISSGGSGSMTGVGMSGSSSSSGGGGAGSGGSRVLSVYACNTLKTVMRYKHQVSSSILSSVGGGGGSSSSGGSGGNGGGGITSTLVGSGSLADDILVSLSWSTNDTLLTCVTSNGNILKWNMMTGERVHEQERMEEAMNTGVRRMYNDVVMLPDGNIVTVGIRSCPSNRAELSSGGGGGGSGSGSNTSAAHLEGLMKCGDGGRGVDKDANIAPATSRNRTGASSGESTRRDASTLLSSSVATSTQTQPSHTFFLQWSRYPLPPSDLSISTRRDIMQATQYVHYDSGNDTDATSGMSQTFMKKSVVASSSTDPLDLTTVAEEDKFYSQADFPILPFLPVATKYHQMRVKQARHEMLMMNGGRRIGASSTLTTPRLTSHNSHLTTITTERTECVLPPLLCSAWLTIGRVSFLLVGTPRGSVQVYQWPPPLSSSSTTASSSTSTRATIHPLSETCLHTEPITCIRACQKTQVVITTSLDGSIFISSLALILNRDMIMATTTVGGSTTTNAASTSTQQQQQQQNLQQSLDSRTTVFPLHLFLESSFYRGFYPLSARYLLQNLFGEQRRLLDRHEADSAVQSRRKQVRREKGYAVLMEQEEEYDCSLLVRRSQYQQQQDHLHSLHSELTSLKTEWEYKLYRDQTILHKKLQENTRKYEQEKKEYQKGEEGIRASVATHQHTTHQALLKKEKEFDQTLIYMENLYEKKLALEARRYQELKEQIVQDEIRKEMSEKKVKKEHEMKLTELQVSHASEISQMKSRHTSSTSKYNDLKESSLTMLQQNDYENDLLYQTHVTSSLHQQQSYEKQLQEYQEAQALIRSQLSRSTMKIERQALLTHEAESSKSTLETQLKEAQKRTLQQTKQMKQFEISEEKLRLDLQQSETIVEKLKQEKLLLREQVSSLLDQRTSNNPSQIKAEFEKIVREMDEEFYEAHLLNRQQNSQQRSQRSSIATMQREIGKLKGKLEKRDLIFERLREDIIQMKDLRSVREKYAKLFTKEKEMNENGTGIVDADLSTSQSDQLQIDREYTRQTRKNHSVITSLQNKLSSSSHQHQKTNAGYVASNIELMKQINELRYVNRDFKNEIVRLQGEVTQQKIVMSTYGVGGVSITGGAKALNINNSSNNNNNNDNDGSQSDRTSIAHLIRQRKAQHAAIDLTTDSPPAPSVLQTRVEQLENLLLHERHSNAMLRDRMENLDMYWKQYGEEVRRGKKFGGSGVMEEKEQQVSVRKGMNAKSPTRKQQLQQQQHQQQQVDPPSPAFSSTPLTTTVHFHAPTDPEPDREPSPDPERPDSSASNRSYHTESAASIMSLMSAGSAASTGAASQPPHISSSTTSTASYIDSVIQRAAALRQQQAGGSGSTGQMEHDDGSESDGDDREEDESRTPIQTNTNKTVHEEEEDNGQEDDQDDAASSVSNDSIASSSSKAPFAVRPTTARVPSYAAPTRSHPATPSSANTGRPQTARKPAMASSNVRPSPPITQRGAKTPRAAVTTPNAAAAAATASHRAMVSTWLESADEGEAQTPGSKKATAATPTHHVKPSTPSRSTHS